MALTVMTYNIRVGVESDLPSLAAAIRAAGVPDLIAFQEIGVGWYMGGGADQPAALAAAVGLEHHRFAGALRRDDGGQFGVALAARWPLTDVEITPLPRDTDEQRVLLRAVLDTPQGPITVFCTHLSVAGPERLEQARVIHAAVQGTPGPVILLGDLNDRPQTPTLEVLRAGLTDCFDARGEGPSVTFSVVDPHRRIDYILCGGGLGPSGPARVIREATASDHFPLVARIDALG
ncbi:MAG: endonuclease/exonuclease/phosphatase family protein [Myxococcales bacterium]|nr:endonuclease/exonuclease/phosphatase family protein [Myxococcales bacterium]MCB9522138.1 endonuclease/exonuclease/phosphatase family protein [Myxococcales bacterium]